MWRRTAECGGVLCDVLDCGGTVALENDSGTFRIQCQHHPFLRLGGCEGHCAESWTGESQGTGSENAMVARGCSREGLQIKSIASKANKADLGTKVLPVARLNALRGACGIVVPGEMSRDAVESENELYPD